MNSKIFVHGLGAVSPAGWGVPALSSALNTGAPLPVQTVSRPGWEKPLHLRSVPPPPVPPAFLAHPRLRRSGAMTQNAVGAACEALGDDVKRVQSGELRLGIIVCLMPGCVTYSRRFYEEVLRDPATASPLIFPETVFNAPASHLVGLSRIRRRSIIRWSATTARSCRASRSRQTGCERGHADACIVVGRGGDGLDCRGRRAAVPARHDLQRRRGRALLENTSRRGG